MDDHQGFQREVRRNFRWNFIVNTLDSSIYIFGISFFTTDTILLAFYPVAKKPTSLRNYLLRLSEIFTKNRNFTLFR